MEAGFCHRKGDISDFYVYYPKLEMHSPFRRHSILILREDSKRETAEELMKKWKLSELAENCSCLIAFPNPPAEGWASMDNKDLAAYLREVQSKMCEPEDYVFETDKLGIPTLSSMLNRWHLMNDTRYYTGIGEGADAACRMAMEAPKEMAALFCITDEKNRLPQEKLAEIRMPLRVEGRKEAPALMQVYEEFFCRLRRLNTGKYGDVGERMDFSDAHFDCYINEKCLEDGQQLAHTWFVHMPSGRKEKYGEKLPLLLFFHGGSDNPAEAAEMSRFHELGEKEGFITVYPWGSDTASWNCNYSPDGKDDVAYIHALIQWMKAHYPIEEKRIYLSGFSNGAAMAQVYAMEYPGEIAGICHIDSNWPGHRLGLAGVEASEVAAFTRGWKQKEVYDYLMPVWYTYGTGEPSYPVYRGCSQQLQYDFWKSYNHIALADTPEKENPHSCGCGVPGQVCGEIAPSEKYPDHVYQINRFYSEKEGHLNLYNYVVMHDKGHEVAPMDAALGWNYVKRFQREKDGSLTVRSEGEEK